MLVATCAARCADCGAALSYPELGDFAYGEFVFAGEHGTVFAHFAALGSPVWRLVKDVLVAAGLVVEGSASSGTVIQRTCAAIADPVESQHLRAAHVCPACLLAVA